MYFEALRDLPDRLISRARELEKLVDMPDRVKADDIKKAAKSLFDAADAMRQLMQGSLPGCTCRLIDDDGRFYHVYDENCTHHRHLKAQADDNKKRYDDAHKKLTNEVRVQMVTQLIGHVFKQWCEDDDEGEGFSESELAQRTIAIADAAIAELDK